MRTMKMLLFIIAVFIGLVGTNEAKVSAYTDDQIADAIYIAEGGAKTRHPYGILTKYKVTTPRQACINTIRSARKRYAQYKGPDDFIHFLSLTYCPIGCENDDGNNRFWEANVKYALERR